MPTNVLIDPWLFSFTAEQLSYRFEELEPILAEINQICADYPVTLAGFLSSENIERIANDYRKFYRGRNGRTFALLIVNIELH